MVHYYSAIYKELITTLNIFLYIIILIALYSIIEAHTDILLNLIIPTISIISVKVIAKVSSRVITNNDIIRADDRRIEIINTTHHFIAIARDLKARAEFVKHMLDKKSNQPAYTITQIVSPIENRYEALLDRKAYKFLPGPCIDIITKISPFIFSIRIIAQAINNLTKENPNISLNELIKADKPASITGLVELINELEELIKKLYELRYSIETEEEKAARTIKNEP